jgi:Ca2+-binding protein (EF-Hand superfamily)
MNKRLLENPESFLTPEEKQSIRETFELFDKDGDDCLDERELKKCLEGIKLLSFGLVFIEFGQHPTDEEILKMIHEVDQSNKGCIGILFLNSYSWKKNIRTFLEQWPYKN